MSGNLFVTVGVGVLLASSRKDQGCCWQPASHRWPPQQRTWNTELQCRGSEGWETLDVQRKWWPGGIRSVPEAFLVLCLENRAQGTWQSVARRWKRRLAATPG